MTLDIHRWLERDQTTDYRTRLLRDRGIGEQLSETDERGRVLAWWRHVTEQHDGAGDGLSERFERLRSRAGWLLFGLGSLLGAAASTTALAYSGSYPLNLLGLFGALLLLPLMLLGLSILGLSIRSMGWMSPTNWFTSFNLARIAANGLDRLVGVNLFSHYTRGGPVGDVAAWQITVFGQQMAVGFYLAVIFVLLVSVAFSDLAFGWSTTLDVSVASVHQLFLFFGAPWAWLFPAYLPSAELVDASRYFRISGADASTETAQQLGQWWPYVVLCLAFWGLLPRLGFWGWSRWRLVKASERLLVDHEEVIALIRRLQAPRSDFVAAPETQVRQPTDDDEHAAVPMPNNVGLVVDWHAARESLADGVVDLSALGVVSVNAQNGIGDVPEVIGDVLWLVKGWEPPTLDLIDALQAVRVQIGEAAAFIVLPINLDGSGVDPSDRSVWSEALHRNGVTNCYVVREVAELR